ncbi:hypothetical protein ACMVCI_004318 [Yersinia enterocolitica]|nr:MULTISPECIES: hypothetical protein [Yersinia]EKN3343038.1 hypothetical protein [Yersinia enterocolitica]EKN3361643.1 hypothetical protein [Yersinia ruckeri]EKN3386554.1 hypothetical protein [Yersinia enterocolitica]EKN3395112.1 hypothetical protein [Yersinia enterocolitica]EKN3402028.1 hypothetical protein [Yersinia enterocolitica]
MTISELYVGLNKIRKLSWGTISIVFSLAVAISTLGYNLGGKLTQNNNIIVESELRGKISNLENENRKLISSMEILTKSRNEAYDNISKLSSLLEEKNRKIDEFNKHNLERSACELIYVEMKSIEKDIKNVRSSNIIYPFELSEENRLEVKNLESRHATLLSQWSDCIIK